MKSAENIKQSIKRLNITARPELHDRVLGGLLKTMEESVKKPSAITRPNIWRMIMKPKITKFAAAAAMIIIAVMIGINQFGGSIDIANKTFALEQAINALKHVKSKHVIMTTFNPMNRYEFWTQYSNDGRVISSRRESPGGRLYILADGVSYSYEPAYDSNTKQIKAEGSKVYVSSKEVVNDSPGYLEELSEKVAQEGGIMTTSLEISNETQKEIIAATIVFQDIALNVSKPSKISDLEVKIEFDAETKLPIGACEYVIENEDVIKRASYKFYYNEDMPDELFDFEFPDGIAIIDKRSSESTNPQRPEPISEEWQKLIEAAENVDCESLANSIEPDVTWQLEDVVKIAAEHFHQIEDIELTFTKHQVLLTTPPQISEIVSVLKWVPKTHWEQRLDKTRSSSSSDEFERLYSWDEIKEGNARGLGLSDFLVFLEMKCPKLVFPDYMNWKDVFVEGKGIINGRTTIIVNVNHIPSLSRENGLFMRYWLDMQKGALPLRVELYHKNILARVTSDVSIAEIRPGLFFPVKCNVAMGPCLTIEDVKNGAICSCDSYQVDINSIKINQGL